MVNNGIYCSLNIPSGKNPAVRLKRKERERGVFIWEEKIDEGN
jgi:hypothetical protein